MMAAAEQRRQALSRALAMACEAGFGTGWHGGGGGGEATARHGVVVVHDAELAQALVGVCEAALQPSAAPPAR